MINTKLLKVSKRIIIILLMAIFSLSGIVACGGAEDIAGSIVGSYDNTGAVDTTDTNKEPEQPAFPENTYYGIYAPWAEGISIGGVTNVSYQDTNTLTKLWQDLIEGGNGNNGKRLFIRDANNNQSDPLTGSYYYFDKNLNIVYYRQGKGSLTVRKFISGIITKYNAGKDIRLLAIGGIYETILTKNEITGNNFDQLNIFMGDKDMRTDKGALEILTLNIGYAFDNNTEFGVDFYYNKSINSVEEYTSIDPNEIYNILKGRNLSWDTGYVNFKFVSAKPQSWHLEDHLNRQGWHE